MTGQGCEPPAETPVAQETLATASVTAVTPANIFTVAWESAQNQTGNTGNGGNAEIDKFLARVVPSSGHVAICFKGKDNPGMGTRFFPCDRFADATGFIKWCVGKKLDVWFGCASYREVESSTSKGGKPTLKGSRTQENVEALQSFYIDLDIKRAGDGKAPDKVHSDIISAVAWLKVFCANTGMPFPNLWVSSGYGLHLYWIFQNAIDRFTWQPYADALKQALIANEAVGDLGVTVDSARILRPPGTLNFKDPENPQPVKVIGELSPYPNEYIYDKLLPYIRANHGNNDAGASPSQQWGMETHAASFAKIATGCEQVKVSLASGGNGDPYPLWYLGFLSLTGFCADGKAFAHKISSGDPRYIASEVDAALQQIADERARKDTGAPLCSTLNTERPGICQACPHFGKIKSPISLGAEFEYISSGKYRMTKRGLFFKDDEDKSKPVYLSSAFEVLANTRDVDGQSWGKLLRWKDPDLQQHEWSMPNRMLGGNKDDLWRELLDGGLDIASLPASRTKLADYLSRVTVKARARAVAQGGWHLEGAVPVFVLPDGVCGDIGGDRVLLQTERRTDAAYRVAGTIEEWRDQIGRLCVGNSRLTLAVSAAFAAPLLYFGGEESGGLHLVGSSRIGKTVALRVGGSVWGGGTVNGFVKSWRATSNGLEGTAAAHCDALLCLDEIGQVDAREAGEIAYMLANGSGKGRSNRDGSSRRRITWRLLFLSSGEISLSDKMAELGKRPRAGQEVRLVNIPADAGAGLGIFQQLHGFPSAGEFAEHLRAATQQWYGTPARHFLDLLNKGHAANPSAVGVFLQKSRNQFFQQYLPPNASGQVRSVCSRFALLAAAGGLATGVGLTGWPLDEAAKAAGACFQSWLAERGGSGDHEFEAGIRQVIGYIEAHGGSRFENPWKAFSSERIANRVGFRRDDTGDWQYMVLSEQWRSEVAKGYDPNALAREMVKRKLIDPGPNGSPSKTVKVPQNGTLRLYVLAGNILTAPISLSGSVLPGVTRVTSVTNPKNSSISAAAGQIP